MTEKELAELETLLTWIEQQLEYEKLPLSQYYMRALYEVWKKLRSLGLNVKRVTTMTQHHVRQRLKEWRDAIRRRIAELTGDAEKSKEHTDGIVTVTVNSIVEGIKNVIDHFARTVQQNINREIMHAHQTDDDVTGSLRSNARRSTNNTKRKHDDFVESYLRHIDELIQAQRQLLDRISAPEVHVHNDINLNVSRLSGIIQDRLSWHKEEFIQIVRDLEEWQKEELRRRLGLTS